MDYQRLVDVAVGLHVDVDSSDLALSATFDTLGKAERYVSVLAEFGITPSSVEKTSSNDFCAPSWSRLWQVSFVPHTSGDYIAMRSAYRKIGLGISHPPLAFVFIWRKLSSDELHAIAGSFLAHDAIVDYLEIGGSVIIDAGHGSLCIKCLYI